MSGTFHPYAGSPPSPLQPLHVDLKAVAIASHLEPDANAELAFLCHSTHSVATHASFRHIVTLSNLQTCPLICKMHSEGPFDLVSATPSAPQVGAWQPPSLAHC